MLKSDDSSGRPDALLSGKKLPSRSGMHAIELFLFGDQPMVGIQNLPGKHRFADIVKQSSQTEIVHLHISQIKTFSHDQAQKSYVHRMLEKIVLHASGIDEMHQGFSRKGKDVAQNMPENTVNLPHIRQKNVLLCVIRYGAEKSIQFFHGFAVYFFPNDPVGGDVGKPGIFHVNVLNAHLLNTANP